MIESVIFTGNISDEKQLNALINDGFKLWAVVPGWGFSEDFMVDPYIILHKPDQPDAQPVDEPYAPLDEWDGVIPEPKDEPDEFDTQPLTEPDFSLEGFKAMVRAGDFVVLDTETTGLHNGEICEISIIDADGNVLLDTFVKTKDPIPGDATVIHHITDEMVKDCTTWINLQPKVRSILAGQNVVIYNATYDRKMMHQSDDCWGIPYVDYKAEATYWDAMEHYAEFYGAWNDWHKSFTWQRLSNAALQQGVEVKDAHRALGDCLMTLGVIKAMAK